MTTLRAISAGQVGSGEAWVANEEPPVPWCRGKAIDVGGTKAVGTAVGATFPEVLVLTHDDQDHIAGFPTFADIAIDHLGELWIPHEWGILAVISSQLSSGAPSDFTVDESLLAKLVMAAALDPDDDPASNERLAQMVAKARGNLRDLSRNPRDLERFGRLIKQSTVYPRWRMIGTPEDVARRTSERGEALLEILHRALSGKVSIRFFSVDGVDYSHMKPWQSAGAPGSLTIANAVEAGVPRRWPGPPMASLVFVLGLTIQNRRALCPVVWHQGSLEGSAMIWSDSGGEWIPASGFDLSPLVGLHSAPHHGSASCAHENVWGEIRKRPDAALVAAGGMSRQGVHYEFLHWDADLRACTRCRHPAPRNWATDVTAVANRAGEWSLNPPCDP